MISRRSWICLRIAGTTLSLSGPAGSASTKYSRGRFNSASINCSSTRGLPPGIARPWSSRAAAWAFSSSRRRCGSVSPGSAATVHSRSRSAGTPSTRRRRIRSRGCGSSRSTKSAIRWGETAARLGAVLFPLVVPMRRDDLQRPVLLAGLGPNLAEHLHRGRIGPVGVVQQQHDRNGRGVGLPLIKEQPQRIEHHLDPLPPLPVAGGDHRFAGLRAEAVAILLPLPCVPAVFEPAGDVEQRTDDGDEPQARHAEVEQRPEPVSVHALHTPPDDRLHRVRGEVLQGMVEGVARLLIGVEFQPPPEERNFRARPVVKAGIDVVLGRLGEEVIRPIAVREFGGVRVVLAGEPTIELLRQAGLADAGHPQQDDELRIAGGRAGVIPVQLSEQFIPPVAAITW